MILTCINQKGGVGKTTTVSNIGAYLASKGHQVLLVDVDPQANLTSGLHATHNSNRQENNEHRMGVFESMYDVLVRKKLVSDIIIHTDIKNLDLAPSSIELAGAEIELVSALSRESVLKNALNPVYDKYEFILIDCPPSLGLLTINAMVAADQIIIPVQCEYYALEGLSQLINTIKLIQSNINQQLKIGGVVLTMYDTRTNLSKDIADEIHKYFTGVVFDTIVPRNIRLSEAPSHGKPIQLYDPNSTGAKAYEKLAVEFADRFGKKSLGK